MYDENPGEIDFGSSQREVRVSEGSSYREETIYISFSEDNLQTSLPANSRANLGG